jgi:hypothetical protein
LRGGAAHPARFLRWPLAPGGLAARGWLIPRRQARSRSRPLGAREGASESAQLVLSVIVVETP